MNGTEQHTTLEELLELYDGKLSKKDETILVGDLNARTGAINTEFDSNTANSLRRSYPSRSWRSSRDVVVNSRGRTQTLLDILACTNLRFLNGNIVGDMIGQYTCQTYN